MPPKTKKIKDASASQQADGTPITQTDSGHPPPKQEQGLTPTPART